MRNKTEFPNKRISFFCIITAFLFYLFGCFIYSNIDYHAWPESGKKPIVFCYAIFLIVIYVFESIRNDIDNAP